MVKNLQIHNDMHRKALASLLLALALSVLTLTHSILLMTITEHSRHIKLWPNNTALSMVWRTACLEILQFKSVFTYSLFLIVFFLTGFFCALVSNEEAEILKLHFKTHRSLRHHSEKNSEKAFWGSDHAYYEENIKYFKTTLVISLSCFLSDIVFFYLDSYIVLCLSIHFLSHLILWYFF